MRMRNSNLEFVELLRVLTRGLLRNNNYYVLAVVFVHYVLLEFRKFKNLGLVIRALPDDVFKRIVQRFFGGCGEYVDSTCCAVGSKGFWGSWVNICCEGSIRKFRTRYLGTEGVEGVVYISETILCNIQNALQCKDVSTYFILPAGDEPHRFASEVKISMISNPYDCPNDLVDIVLNNYFSSPKYLRKNDIITADIKELAPGLYYSLPSPQLRLLHFRVNSVTIEGKRTLKPAYVYQTESTLIQEGEIHHYLPRNFKLSVQGLQNSTIVEEFQRGAVDNCPEFLEKYLKELEACILPFITSDNWLGLKPVFLVEGPQGSGKYHLINALSKRLGLNFFNVDCSEIQSLSPSQTEAKLRISFNNATKCVPCILKLSNIQILGKNFEGKIDDRVTSNFSHQLAELYSNKFILIIIATSESSELPSELTRNFVAQIKVNYLSENERINLIDWFLKIQRVDHSNMAISKISAMCSDYLMSDLQSLTQSAVKKRYEKSKTPGVINLEEQDFTQSYKSMQSIFSDEIGAPRIPEVHWEDIGGIASLKHEIIRRIEIPLMQNSGIKSSGILLYGPPGTGKTLLAKAVATECKLNFLSVKGPELLNMYVGQSEKNVRDVFEKARSASPCIIFFDELDALAPNRGRSGDSAGVMDRIVSQLLAEMDGLGSSTSTFIIGATNRPDLIDPALLRPGRFDKLLYVGIYSDRESQLSVLKAITRKFSLGGEKILANIVDQLPRNLTGADLQAVCSNAWLNAAKRLINNYENDLKGKGKRQKPDGVVEVLQEDFVEALRGLVPSVSEKELRRYEQLQRELTSTKK
ncbi:peroxisomal ATPase PEX6 [Diachasmimorpha longicaudata]|uniref:peroxisomal ATPase PEX6 n=1 Tax=Diachasmimorpha longicaudata TaxID=58733 RepID=UPI0030B87FBE